ncbi:carboxylesterase [Silicimonas algicola]|uniref:Holin (3TMs family) n=1 Tax=Silicimonas algicola TaxID=1826607 RepID=A0A316G7I2_9RHOB|nr:holin family protein [Silicimonas algicola]AZQ67254.1 carboxylesterase [Silicimonas algicola]PWK56919.1 holin (3TMs family) [Silicimonas algicola]
MGLIGDLFGVVLGGGRNAVRETVEVFRPNAEAQAVRDAAQETAALAQFASEFALPRQGWFDRLMDGLNRLPRPMMALGTLALLVSAMFDPMWFAARMQGIALVPEPLWWLMGAIVSYYFGARHQSKSQDFQRGLALTLAAAPQVVRNVRALEALAAGYGGRDEAEDTPNAALDEWRAGGER